MPIHTPQLIPQYELPEDLKGKNTSSIQHMFNDIAPEYDKLNSIISWGMHVRWRQYAVESIAKRKPRAVLDLACGTGDLSIALAKALPLAQIIAVDMAENMIACAKEKARAEKLSGRIEWLTADALHLPFADNSFDAVSIAFGIRNFEDIQAGIREIRRVLKVSGAFYILELSEPEEPLLYGLYKLYTHTFVPLIGRVFSGDRKAYSYLPQSIQTVPRRMGMCELLSKNGFISSGYKSFFPGVCLFYTSYKT